MPRSIQAAVTKANSSNLEFVEAFLADPGPHEVVVELAASGICHTDLKAIETFPAPAVFGHEGAGHVVAIGSQVKKVKPGDRVAMSFGYCGNCESCVENSPAYCWHHGDLNSSGRRADGSNAISLADNTPLFGSFFQQSSFASHALATQNNVVPIPDELPFEIAAPLGCSIQTGVGAVINLLKPKPHQSIAVFGVGGVGLSAIMAAQMVGVKTIIAIDPNTERLELAQSLGAHIGLDPNLPSLIESIKQATGGGAHCSIDAAGRPQSFSAAINCLRPRGTCGVMTTPGGWGEDVAHPGGMALMTTKLMGLIEGDAVPDRFIPQLANWVIDGQLPIDRLIKSYPFLEVNSALEDMRSGRTVKPVLLF